MMTVFDKTRSVGRGERDTRLVERVDTGAPDRTDKLSAARGIALAVGISILIWALIFKLLF